MSPKFLNPFKSCVCGSNHDIDEATADHLQPHHGPEPALPTGQPERKRNGGAQVGANDHPSHAAAPAVGWSESDKTAIKTNDVEVPALEDSDVHNDTHLEAKRAAKAGFMGALRVVEKVVDGVPIPGVKGGIDIIISTFECIEVRYQ